MASNTLLIQREVIDSAREWLADHLSDNRLPASQLAALNAAGLDSLAVEGWLLNQRETTSNSNSYYS